MNDDELKKLWQQQPLREPVPSAAQLISAMQKQTNQLRRILDARDLRELVSCAVVMIVFGCFASFLHAHQPIAQLGDWMVIASAIYIAWKLIYTRRSTPSAPPGATIVESLRAELTAVQAQSQLLGSVLWWYLLPSFVGQFVMTWGGLPINDPASLVVMIPANIMVTMVFIAVDVFIYHVNQSVGADQLLPLEAQLKSLLHSAETGEPLDETQITDLRPIALSLAAAEQVKPDYFKIAFWQIALWGEIGFLGIWFFLMVALTIGDTDAKTTEPAPETIPPSVRVEESNHESIVARKVVDLLNARDYAGVQELFNATMSEALPPPKASEFFANLTARFGHIKSFDGPTGNGYRGWNAFRLHCQRGEATMTLALDPNDNIAGIYFQPAFPDLQNFKSFVPRLFSPLHLALIVPFFLAGLLFSWILQQQTDRAVGISTLGLHLEKGQSLILWDEIKDIRPIRVLNIQSLWLIRVSGEKTIIPWTSLERHSYLKEAVECFAPANHPLRRYLPVLRRT